MLERIVLSLLLTLLLFLTYVALRTWHMRRVSKLTMGSSVEVDRPTLLYFRSDYCAPCQTQAHYLQDLARQYSDRLVIKKIDADVDIDTANRFGIFTLPTTLFVDPNGEVKYINYGLTAKEKLVRQLENIV